MSEERQTLYLKIEQNCIVYRRNVVLGDIAKIESSNTGMLRQVLQMDFYRFADSDREDDTQVFSILKVIQKIHEQFPAAQVVNLGAPDFVIRYVDEPEKKGVQYAKAAILCAILFFGAAFTIMTFLEDVAVRDMFAKFYHNVTGHVSRGVTPLEISFCLGLAAGILVFYNHIGGKKITDDPTPIQVAMRKYEQDVDTTYIETSGRKGESVDVDE